MAHEIAQNPALARIAAEHTHPLMEVAEDLGGDAGAALLNYMISGADSSMGELELRLGLGALATAVLDLSARVAELETTLDLSRRVAALEAELGK
jgi:hypothetical protein